MVHESLYRKAQKTFLLLLDELPSDLVNKGLINPEREYKVRDLIRVVLMLRIRVIPTMRIDGSEKTD